MKLKARFGAVALLLAAALVPVGVASAQTRDGEAGRLGWCELLTHDAAAVTGFYSSLFGWQIEPDADGTYRVTRDGATIGGITQIARRSPEVDESTWLVGFTVDDVERAMAAARRKGGEVLRGLTRARNGAEWAVVQDAQGAQAMVFTGGEQTRAAGAPGHWVWAELWTTDRAAATSFYADLTGWNLEEMEHPNGMYPVFQRDGEARAGLVEISGDRVRPGWAPYVAVEDLATTLKRTIELGGQVLLEPEDDIHAGRVAILADPGGVPFLVLQMDADATPEEGR